MSLLPSEPGGEPGNAVIARATPVLRLAAALALAAATVLAGGCAAPPERTLSTERPPFVALPSGRDPMNPSEKVPLVAEAGGDIALFERWQGRPINVLQLSGGGRNGAFGAGVLVGWSESGERPAFDIVTGISTGGLQATFAFLGTRADDQVLEELYTGITNDDIYWKRGLIDTLTGSSFLNPSPLVALIETHVDEALLERVAAEWDRGRMLLVGTANLDRGQLWVWNLTRLAREGGAEALETYRKVVLASASPPAAFPPVEIAGHLFADGAVLNNLLIIGQAGPPPEREGSSQRRTGNVYVINNGRSGSAPEAVSPALEPLTVRAVDMAIDAHTSASLLRSFAVTMLHGYQFHLMEVPESVVLDSKTLEFDQAKMRELFEAGRELGRRNEWLPAPPPTPEVRSWLIEQARRLAPTR